VREDVQMGVRKEWTETHDECLQEEREEWRRLCHRMTYPGGNFKTNDVTDTTETVSHVVG